MKSSSFSLLVSTLLVPIISSSAATIMAKSRSGTETLYFGYGSNLWLDQMRMRCPNSTYAGIGRLPHYRWIINDRGYANVVEQESSSKNSNHEVYGLIYTLTAADEEALDKNEGVPYAYTKEWIDIQFWPSTTPSEKVDLKTKPETKSMLVYIDRRRVTKSTPKKEYIYRMNKGIDDALAAGVPSSYVDIVMRSFIPPLDEEDQHRDLKEKAKKQALNFEDEND